MNMSLDEAIEHCEEVAKENRELFEKIGTSHYDEDNDNCLECAKAHEQLAEWLKELKRQRESWEKVKAEIQSLADEDWNKKVGTESGGLETALKIIDKYKAESEVPDAENN